jgi:hypothetical protein
MIGRRRTGGANQGFFRPNCRGVDILTPEHRYTPDHRERCIGLLLNGAERASARLAYRADVGS